MVAYLREKMPLETGKRVAVIPGKSMDQIFLDKIWISYTISYTRDMN